MSVEGNRGKSWSQALLSSPALLPLCPTMGMMGTCFVFLSTKGNGSPECKNQRAFFPPPYPVSLPLKLIPTTLSRSGDPAGQSDGGGSAGPCGFRCWNRPPGWQVLSTAGCKQPGALLAFAQRLHFFTHCPALSLLSVTMAGASHTHRALSAETQAKGAWKWKLSCWESSIFFGHQVTPTWLVFAGWLEAGPGERRGETQAPTGSLHPELLVTGS